MVLSLTLPLVTSAHAGASRVSSYLVCPGISCCHSYLVHPCPTSCTAKYSTYNTSETSLFRGSSFPRDPQVRVLRAIPSPPTPAAVKSNGGLPYRHWCPLSRPASQHLLLACDANHHVQAIALVGGLACRSSVRSA